MYIYCIFFIVCKFKIYSISDLSDLSTPTSSGSTSATISSGNFSAPETSVTSGNSRAPAASSSPDVPPKFWGKDDTKLLVNTRLSMEKEFSERGIRSHKVLWAKVRDVLRENEVEVTSTQCINKFKQLKRDWRSVLDHNRKTGVEPKSCAFLDEFNSAYGCSASAKPDYTWSTLQSPKPRPREPDDSCLNDSSGIDLDEVDSPELPRINTEPAKKRKKKVKRCRSDSDNATLEFLKQYEERQNEHREKHFQELKRMNDEKLSIMSRLVDIMEKK